MTPTNVSKLIEPLHAGERFSVHTIPLHLVDRLVAAYDLKVFIETGTCLGNTVEMVCHQFEEIYTIELDPQLTENARWKFKANPHVHVLEGDSGKILDALVTGIQRTSFFSDAKRALIWLDAHWSGGITARGSVDTAIVDELKALHRAVRKDHVLMIDDLAEFVGANGYPVVDELIQRVNEINPAYSIHTLDLRRGVLIALP